MNVKVEATTVTAQPPVSTALALSNVCVRLDILEMERIVQVTVIESSQKEIIPFLSFNILFLFLSRISDLYSHLEWKSYPEASHIL